MSENQSAQAAEQSYFAVQRLQNYVLTMMLLSGTIGLSLGMLLAEPTKLMVIVSGLGVSTAGLLIMYTGSEYPEIDSAVGFREKDEPAFWHRILKPRADQ